jgi:hypothetical protein
VEETVEHLFLGCPFASSWWSLFNLTIVQGDTFQILASLRAQLNVAFFMDIVILIFWSIWTARNGFIFEGRQPDLHSVSEKYKSEFALVILGSKLTNVAPMKLWTDSIL